MIKKIIDKINWIGRIALSKLGFKRQYSINKYSIQLSYTHRLPDYEQSYPFYDMFLPHIVKYLPPKSLVIDVGANVGDTLVRMVGSCDEINYLCIEATKEFFLDLSKNVKRLKNKNSDLKIDIVNSFVGKDLNNIQMSGVKERAGTRFAEISKGSIQSKCLDSILLDLNIDKSNLSLLKIDTDGFDWDVIRSSNQAILHNPYIFFECFYINDYQLKNYRNIFSELLNLGYSKFAFFDNYGQFLISTSNIDQIYDLLNYIKRQNYYDKSVSSNIAYQKINYFDVLAYDYEKEDEVSSIINDYQKNQDDFKN